jgi:hypothetical protein
MCILVFTNKLSQALNAMILKSFFSLKLLPIDLMLDHVYNAFV